MQHQGLTSYAFVAEYVEISTAMFYILVFEKRIMKKKKQ